MTCWKKSWEVPPALRKCRRIPAMEAIAAHSVPASLSSFHLLRQLPWTLPWHLPISAALSIATISHAVAALSTAIATSTKAIAAAIAASIETRKNAGPTASNAAGEDVHAPRPRAIAAPVEFLAYPAHFLGLSDPVILGVRHGCVVHFECLCFANRGCDVSSCVECEGRNSGRSGSDIRLSKGFIGEKFFATHCLVTRISSSGNKSGQMRKLVKLQASRAPLSRQTCLTGLGSLSRRVANESLGFCTAIDEPR